MLRLSAYSSHSAGYRYRFLFEYDAGKKFDLLNAVNEETLVKVIVTTCAGDSPKDVVVGDIVVLETGEEVPADGELLKPFPASERIESDRSW